MRYFYLIILHGFYILWMCLWLLLIYGTIFNISADQTSSGHVTGFLLILFLFIFWTANYLYQVKCKTWKILLIGNILSFAIPFLIVQYLLPFIVDRLQCEIKKRVLQIRDSRHPRDSELSLCLVSFLLAMKVISSHSELPVLHGSRSVRTTMCRARGRFVHQQYRNWAAALARFLAAGWRSSLSTENRLRWICQCISHMWRVFLRLHEAYTHGWVRHVEFPQALPL